MSQFFDLINNAFEDNPQNEPINFFPSKNSLDVLEKRYFLDKYSDNGMIKEKTFSELCMRVAKVISAFETKYSDDIEWIHKLNNNMYYDMLNGRYLFNSPALFSSGRGMTIVKDLCELIYKPIEETTLDEYKMIVEKRDKTQMLAACFVLDIEDSLEGIYDSLKETAIISKYGGGVGLSFSNLREKGGEISGGVGGTSTGAVSWMKDWDTMANNVVQGGKRRAALMGMLRSNHPEIEDFIKVKTEEGVLPFFNISVAFDDKFMKAAMSEENNEYELLSRVPDNYMKPVKEINAKKLWNEICESAWKKGDPGIFFIDNANRDNILKETKVYEINATNPCGEEPLNSFSSCVLGSINLIQFVQENEDEEKGFNANEFVKQVYRSSYYLDLIPDASVFPIDKVTKSVEELRPIGLGLMGLANTFIKLGIPYKSQKATILTTIISRLLAGTAISSNIKRSQIKKPVNVSNIIGDLFESEGYEIDKYNFEENIDDINKQIISIIDTKENKDSKIPISWRNMLASFIYCVKAFENDENPSDKTIDIYDIKEILPQIYHYFSDVFSGNVRNSRMLSIAPTGSISLILDSSSSIEPIFFMSWQRKIFANSPDEEDTVLDFYHPLLNTQDITNIQQGKRVDGDYWITANELDVEGHLIPVMIFSGIIDSGISKTVNLPSEATVEDVKNIYELCYKSGIKGITIYRDGSRDNQPISEKSNEIVEEKFIDTENYSGQVKSRPPILAGLTEKASTPFGGSVYVTSNYLGGEPFEVKIDLGKSGSEIKALTEALGRIISIGLRSGVKLENIIKTMSNISGSELWLYDTYDGDCLTAKSMPDIISKILTNLDKYIMDNGIFGTSLKNNEKIDAVISKDISNKDNICPECGSAAYQMTGSCESCLSCGYSKCKSS